MTDAYGRKNNDIENETNYDNSNSFENTENILIEKHILYCSSHIIEKEQLRKLSEEELYYIRNGIYAYAGMIFEGEYYCQFDWYKGDISNEDFSWENLNMYQQKNIEHIREIEKEKEL